MSQPKFRVGDLVVLNEDGRRRYLSRRSLQGRKIGVVVGRSRKHPHVVYVKWDGLIHPTSISEGFLDWADPSLPYEETLRKICGPSMRRALHKRLVHVGAGG